MVTSNHEAAHRIFQEHPEVLPQVFELLGVPMPANSAYTVVTPDATEMRPLVRHIDTVLRIDPPEGGGYLLAVESQGKRAPDKPADWMYYVAYLATKYELPVLLLVTSSNRKTAKWAAGPFKVGTDGWGTMYLYPLVAGPANIPRITDVAEARANLGLAVFATAIHAHDNDPSAILNALAGAFATVAQPSTADAELVEAGLGDTKAGEIWRHLMAITRKPDGTTIVGAAREEGREEGTVHERARAVLRVLDTRGVVVSEAARERVTSCTDLDTLDGWLERAVTVDDADRLFDNA